MQTLALNHLTAEEVKEMSLIEITYALFQDQKQSVTFGELLTEIKKLTGFTDEDLRSKLSQFYTDLNVDGRFICIGENQWGLRAWYPYDQIEEETTPQVKTKKKKAKKASDDDDLDADEFEELDEEELEFDDLDDYEEDEAEEEDFDDVDEDDADDDDDEEFEEDLIEDEDYDLEDDEEEEEEDFDEDDEEKL
ncbi:DNA-directed RNA polymerase subunit delta [Bacillus haimaensis]|uniref:DNA-directed RNA polymerase subunit delta n=1 Tax=Bacillus haimaensis TaxID=3160967 RepID=UPI003AA92C14